MAPVLAALLLTVGLVAGTAAAQPTTEASPTPAFVVELDADGSARATLTVPFDLTTAADREAFAALRDDAATRERRGAAFVERMRRVAAVAEAETGRTMRVRDPTVALDAQGDTGVVSLSVTWDGLAAREGDRLVVREPFDDGFATDGEFRVVGPEGYALASVAPTPAERTETGAVWAGDADLDGFSATFAPATDEGDTGASAPGFGTGAALLAVLAGAALVAVRRRVR